MEGRLVYRLSLALLAPLAASLLASGCSSGQGGFTLIPAGNFLLDSTKALRDQAPPFVNAPRELSKDVLDAYIIQPGDVLLIEPESLDSPLRLPTDQTVLPDGKVDLGKFGRLLVAGKTVEQIEADVQNVIKDAGEQKNAVNVRLITARSAVYYVLGEVNSPGSFPLIGRETVLDAILAAGGISPRASRCNIILSRPTGPDCCRVVLPICYRHLTQMGDTTTNYQLLPGDRIYVATRTLCEQLNVFHQNEDCEFCCACQQACPDGQAATAGPEAQPPATIHDGPAAKRRSVKVAQRPALSPATASRPRLNPPNSPRPVFNGPTLRQPAADQADP